MSMMGAELII